MTVIGLVLIAALATGGWLWTPDKDRAELESRYLRSSDDLTMIDGQLLHVRDDGPADAPALLMLHGFGASLHTFEAWAQQLADEFRVISLDLPGSGLSGPAPQADYSDKRTIGLITQLLDQRGIQRATMIGNSMGGRIAWRFAAARPDRTDRLVLIAPDGFPQPGFDYDNAGQVSWTTQIMRYVLPKPLVRASLAPAYADPDRLSPATLQRYHDLLRAPGVRQALIDRLASLKKLDPPPVLATINAPTLLMWGTKDSFIPACHADDYLAALPNAQLVTFEHLGHLPQEEGPAETAATLREFLTESEPQLISALQ